MDFYPTQQFKVVVSEHHHYTGYIIPQELGGHFAVAVYRQLYREILQDRENQYHTDNPHWNLRYHQLIAVLLNPRILEPIGTPIISDEIPFVVDASQNKGEWQKYIRVTYKQINFSALRPLIR